MDFLDFKRRPITTSDRVPGPYPYYGANGLQDHVADYIFDEPLVLLAEDGGHFDDPGRGIAYRISGKTWVNNHAHVLRPRADVDVAYLSRVLENLDVRRFISGTTRSKLTKAGAARIEIPIPHIEEQRRIAEILDRADVLRTKRREAIALLNDLTESIFLDIFGDPISNSRGWDDSAELGELAGISSGITKGRQTAAPTREVPYLAVVNVQDKYLDTSSVKTIHATDAEIDRYRLQAGDLLLTEGGDPDKLGRGSVWRNELAECIHQNHIFRVRVGSSTRLRPVFLNWLVGSQRGKRYFLKSAKQTTGIASINMTQLRAFPLLLPPIERQLEFEQSLAAVVESTNRAEEQCVGLDALFEALQQRAFAGLL